MNQPRQHNPMPFIRDTVPTLAYAQQAGIAPWDKVCTEFSDSLVACFYDRYPVTPGHLLFVPRTVTMAMIHNALHRALMAGDKLMQRGECDAFNVGINCGEEAGQTVKFPHVHLILRRAGDCADPVGGVRGVIPERQNYRANPGLWSGD